MSGLLPPALTKAKNQKGKPNKSKRIPMIPRVTHTRLPEGRQDFKLRAKSGVRLSELTDLTIGLIGSQW